VKLEFSHHSQEQDYRNKPIVLNGIATTTLLAPFPVLRKSCL